MKKIRRNILVALTAFMMFASTGVGVFAADGVADDQNVQAGVTEDGTPAVEADEPEVTEPEAGDTDKVEQDEPEVTEPEAGDTDKVEQDEPEATEPEEEQTKTEQEETEQFSVKGELGLKVYAGYDCAFMIWDGSDKKKYDILVKQGDNVVKSATVSGSDKKIKGLTNDTEYTFRLRLHVDVAEGEDDPGYSDKKTVTTVANELKVVKPTANASYKSVVLEWKPVKGANAYVIERKKDSGKYKFFTLVSDKIENDSYKEKKKLCQFTDENKIKDTHKYRYKVRAVRLAETKKGKLVVRDDSKDMDKLSRYYKLQTADKSKATKKKTSVKPMYITVRPKMNRSLTSKNKVNGKRKTKTFKRGEALKCYGYTAGCFYFMDGKYKFRIARINSYGHKAHYVGNASNQKKGNYTTREAELFVTAYMKANKGYDSYGSGKNYCIWVSYYTQHMFILKRDGKKWVMATSVNDSKFPRDNWECSSGKASTPSYTGPNRINSNRARYMKGIPYWNGYHGKKDSEGNFNGIHGKRPAYVLGEPQSHACIRNANKNAKLIWDAYIIGAAVICF